MHSSRSGVRATSAQRVTTGCSVVGSNVNMSESFRPAADRRCVTVSWAPSARCIVKLMRAVIRKRPSSSSWASSRALCQSAYGYGWPASPSCSVFPLPRVVRHLSPAKKGSRPAVSGPRARCVHRPEGPYLAGRVGRSQAVLGRVATSRRRRRRRRVGRRPTPTARTAPLAVTTALPTVWNATPRHLRPRLPLGRGPADLPQQNRHAPWPI